MKYKVTLNNRTYEVEVEKGAAILAGEYEAAAPAPAAPAAEKPAAAALAAAFAPVSADGEAIASPLPGTVLAVKVSAGEPVRSGQVLVVIEAMKMENDIVAPRDGVVTSVVAAKGTAVNSGDVLLALA